MNSGSSGDDACKLRITALFTGHLSGQDSGLIMVASLRDLLWVGACSGLTCIHCADEVKQSICYHKRFSALKDTAHTDHTVVVCTVGMKFQSLPILKFIKQEQDFHRES